MMRIFVIVAEEGSYTAAARRMNITTARASRSISGLESHLSARLFNRNTRQIALTEVGARYLDHCTQILAHIDEAEAEAANAVGNPSGRLRMHAMTSFAQYYLGAAIARYGKLCPLVSIELALSQDLPNLIDGRYDLSLQLNSTDLRDSRLVSHRLGDVHSVLCAAPSYLDQRGMPLTLRDLKVHTCLQIASSFYPRDYWHFVGPNGLDTIELPRSAFQSMQIDLPEVLAGVLREGTGIGALPTHVALPELRSGALVRVLPEYKLQSLHVYAVYASRKYLDAKVKTFIDFLRNFVPQTLAADEAALTRAQMMAATRRTPQIGLRPKVS